MNFYDKIFEKYDFLFVVMKPAIGMFVKMNRRLIEEFFLFIINIF